MKSQRFVLFVLVSVVVIALLAALLLPSLKSARARSAFRAARRSEDRRFVATAPQRCTRGAMDGIEASSEGRVAGDQGTTLQRVEDAGHRGGGHRDRHHLGDLRWGQTLIVSCQHLQHVE